MLEWQLLHRVQSSQENIAAVSVAGYFRARIFSKITFGWSTASIVFRQLVSVRNHPGVLIELVVVPIDRRLVLGCLSILLRHMKSAFLRTSCVWAKTIKLPMQHSFCIERKDLRVDFQ